MFNRFFCIILVKPKIKSCENVQFKSELRNTIKHWIRLEKTKYNIICVHDITQRAGFN